MKKEDNEKRLARLKQIVLSMPEKPGSYQYYDADGVIIYVGKAKNLKRRVSSYFHKEVDRYKTKLLVSKIENITYTVVNTEEDALLLENSLIKKYNPKYNILLKDGKTYPSICVTNEYFPRIFKTRQINKKFGTFYGPYSHLGSMYTILELIKKLYHPRTCNTPITREGIEKKKYKACLEYHIKNCGAPCIDKQSYEEYQQNMLRAREILKGNTREISRMVYDEMMLAAEELRFEDAERLKQQYLLIDQFCAKSEVVSNTITDVDVFTIDMGSNHFNGNENENDSENENDNNNPTPNETPNHSEGKEASALAFVNFMHVKNGTICQSFTFEYRRKLDETAEEILLQAIPEIRERFASTAKEVIVPFEMGWQIPNGSFFIPQRGDKKHLLELSQMNCRQYRFDRMKQADKLNPEQKSVRLMKELQEKLGIDTLPYHIEAFDNSNISGTDAVAACVVFKKMKPSKKDYRKYEIKTVSGPDDYASMQEVVRRRYGRIKEAMESDPDNEENRLPDLIVCDGGIGQMHCVREVIEDELHLNIHIAGLAKDDKHRTNELLFLRPTEEGDKECVTIQLKTTSELFHVLTQLQDEVHRFAITFHRDKRSKHALHSELDDIKGIGKATKEALLKAFKSVKRIREAVQDAKRHEEIKSAIGAAKAQIIIDHFSQKEKQ